MNSRPITYLCNHQKKHFDWTNELNKDLLEFYNKVHDDPSMRYIYG